MMGALTSSMKAPLETKLRPQRWHTPFTLAPGRRATAYKAAPPISSQNRRPASGRGGEVHRGEEMAMLDRAIARLPSALEEPLLLSGLLACLR